MLHADRKVLKIGNSLGVTFPVEFLQKLDIHQGDEVQMEFKDNQIVIKKSNKVNLPEGISKDFFDVLNETLEEYDETIKGLVDR
ncbi:MULTISPECIES: AbrB/MazE/SpoVT family DNA-binding domain-containing protein [Anoxybacillus]|uniref:Growth regulator n=1 Tax=Anoxybacillus ayderensis TaxID=265546 RepID=A0A0D0GBQ2_9BACL|nr:MULTISPECIES: AbrB/MazE/SpoVT family DNA-binding domain-containing protein [Anoxybacillus]EPZ37930.1 SpoVT/AbrB-like cell growth regulatory protein [Anoxybacillus ayderensis]KIP22655.1 Growth regulator [Anoxybacillus ayderensis]MED0656889.1 AbrB/MazE/SpoVT family DNA-binding domain-containing protein [Anoxybacillus ayderensis]MED0687065.1 AbrB/MazE/SpoVT family DNA-binding domain-containing protein [Anoxybacillus ayderensis]NNU96699.1 AbrB/MazE/SpoVT family DNA-binding domain-containing pro